MRCIVVKCVTSERTWADSVVDRGAKEAATGKAAAAAAAPGSAALGSVPGGGCLTGGGGHRDMSTIGSHCTRPPFSSSAMSMLSYCSSMWYHRRCWRASASYPTTSAVYHSLSSGQNILRAGGAQAGERELGGRDRPSYKARGPKVGKPRQHTQHDGLLRRAHPPGSRVGA